MPIPGKHLTQRLDIPMPSTFGSNTETGGNNRTQRLEITKRIVGLPPGFGAGVVAILSGVHQAKVFDNVEVAQRTLRQMSSSI